ncbi:MAG TPA: amino acid permease [Pirellulaceae bacterium]|jgi:amino acid transporter
MPNRDMMPETAQPRRSLSLLDTTSITVGIIIGSAVYRIAPDVVGGAGSWSLALWIVGGLVALIGAMCYAEMATAFPQVGGTYVYLSEGLGRSVGFAFAWTEFWIVRPGNIGAVAFVMADYAERLFANDRDASGTRSSLIAAGAILVLAILNAVGLRTGTATQNFLTGLKLVGLAALIVVGLSATPSATSESAVATVFGGSLSLALIQIMFAYGGWADMSFVAAEVRDPERNIFRALLLGTGVVTAIYLLVNAAFIHALGLAGVAASKAVAADVLALRLGTLGSTAISLLVVVSCLGTVNGMLFTGARVFYALGTHHPTLRWLGQWNERTGVPLRSLVMQTLITLALVCSCRREGFERLVVFTAPFYWGFIALVAVSLILLRLRGATATAAFRTPFFPALPTIFAVTSGAMVYAAVNYAIQRRSLEALWAFAVIAGGLLLGWIDYKARHR